MCALRLKKSQSSEEFAYDRKYLGGADHAGLRVFFRRPSPSTTTMAMGLDHEEEVISTSSFPLLLGHGRHTSFTDFPIDTPSPSISTISNICVDQSGMTAMASVSPVPRISPSSEHQLSVSENRYEPNTNQLSPDISRLSDSGSQLVQTSGHVAENKQEENSSISPQISKLPSTECDSKRIAIRPTKTLSAQFRRLRCRKSHCVDADIFLNGPKSKTSPSGQPREVNRNGKMQSIQAKQFCEESHNSTCHKLLSFAIPQDPSNKIFAANQLFPNEAVRIGKLCNSTYQSINGSIMIQMRNKFRKDPADVAVNAEVGVSDGVLPSASVCVSTSFSRPGYTFMTGELANTKVLEEIRVNPKLRQWLLSCLIRGTVLLNEKSTTDGFVPPRVRRISDGGLLLNERLPLSYFHELGGALATIGKQVVFKCHCKAESHDVTRIDDSGVVGIGDKFQIKLKDAENDAFLWTGSKFCIGPAVFRE